MAVAELSRAKLPRFLAPGFQSIRHDFPTAVAGDSLQVNQISLTGGIPNFPPGPRDESAGFSGATAQLRSGHDGAGILPIASVCSATRSPISSTQSSLQGKRDLEFL
jgi:hypothetical protein